MSDLLTSSRMFYAKTVSVLTRTGTRLAVPVRSTVTSASAQTQRRWTEQRGGGASFSAVDFDQTREAYKSKNSAELLRSLVVLKLCSYDFLVDKNEEIMALGQKILGQDAFEQFMKMTFYGQFVAGENHQTIRQLIQKNQAFGVGAVLDYSIEEDISQEETEHTAKDSCISFAGKGGIGLDLAEKNYKAPNQFQEQSGGERGACPYSYADEAKCDQHMEVFLKCIKVSGASSKNSFSALKMSALGRPQFLVQLSEVLVKWRRFFAFLALQQDQNGSEVLEHRLDLKHLQECLTRLGAKGDYYGWFTKRKEENTEYCFYFGYTCSLDQNIARVDTTIDVLDWNSLIDDRTNASELLVIPDVEKGQLVPLLEKFTMEEEKQMNSILQRIDILAKYAVENGVCLMVDAEQTYFQPAISRLTMEMQRIHNRKNPVIFNTFQCYLKEAYDNLTMDVELSQREGWHFAAKLVRGAYMYQERQRAKDIGYEDPINPDYESTNRMYHRCLDYVLDEIVLRKNASVMVASHNEDTVKYTLKRMNELGPLPTRNSVYFAQLLGMCDQISFPLGQAGFPVYKYVPYGPVNEVMPYLSRRAQENRGFMKGVQRERQLLWKELIRRLASGELLHSPVY